MQNTSHATLMAYLQEDDYDEAHLLAQGRYNRVEEMLVKEGALAPLSRHTTPEQWDRYWEAVADVYVRMYGLPTVGGAS